MSASNRSVRRAVPARTLLAITVIAVACLASSLALVTSSDGAPHSTGQLTSASSGSGVNPLNFYQKEPAPVGIADFGVGAGGQPYSYNTTAFLGSIDITQLEVNGTASGTAAIGLVNTTVGNSTPVQTVGNTFLPVDALGITFQLNTVLVFVDSGQTYVYWIQDVAGLTPGSCTSSNPVLNFTDYFVGCTGLTNGDNTTAGSIAFEDNVWNFSAPSASVDSSSISGNGSVSSFDGIGYYADSAASTAPGNEVTLTYPSDVEFRVGSLATPAGIPEVTFQYNDGWGWQTFDAPTFPFATHVSSDTGYLVDGNSYNPAGLYYDAELTIGGAGAGTYSGLGPATNVYMTESYWNGHNFEYIPNAYNFGSDTAESVKYVSSTAQFLGTGAVGNHVVGGGSGSLGATYNAGQIGTLAISTPASDGTVAIGSASAPFVGGSFTQHVGPSSSGDYEVSVTSGSTTEWSGYVDVTAGQTVSIATASYHATTFRESGLGTGTSWQLTIGSVSYASTSSTIVVFLENGKYSWSAASTGHGAKGTVTVKGKSQTVNVKL
jgi:hypothetical protein